VKNRADSYRRAQSWNWSKAVLGYANRGATSLYSTAPDLALWLDNFRTGRVGGMKLVQQMQERGVLNKGDTINYAIGVVIDKDRGLRTIAHGGADAGFRTSVAYYRSWKPASSCSATRQARTRSSPRRLRTSLPDQRVGARQRRHSPTCNTRSDQAHVRHYGTRRLYMGPAIGYCATGHRPRHFRILSQRDVQLHVLIGKLLECGGLHRGRVLTDLNTHEDQREHDTNRRR
jgi:hypothetical protein